MELLRVEHLSKIYGAGENQVKALDDVSLSVEKGEFVAIVGASGSGKSTLLHLLGGVDRPTSGKVYINGTDIFAMNDDELAIFRRRQVGIIYQFYNLIPILNVEENMAIPMELDGRKVEKAQMDDMLLRLGLTERRTHLPNELSGGEQQRVGIVRALATKPDIILMDEPFSALDPLSRRSLQDLVLELHADLHTTILFVTHDMSEATRLGNRIGVMYDGVLQQVGTPTEVTTHPANELVEAMFSERPATMIQAILDAGFGEPITELGDEPQLQATDYLAELSKQLVDHPAVVINGTTKLTVQDLLQYLAAF